MRMVRSIIKRLLRYRQEAQLVTSPPVRVKDPVPVRPDGRPWRAAVIGAGGWGQAQCSVIAALEHVELTAVADARSEAMLKLGDGLQPPRTRHYTDPAAMLAGEELDLVSIATNSASHVPLALAAAEAGVQRIIVEKPIGTSISEARTLVDLCESRGVKLSVDQSRRWSGDYEAIRRYLDLEAIGKLRHITMILGGGGLGMSGIHFLDLMQFFARSDAAWITGFVESETAPGKEGRGFFDPAGYGIVGFSNGIRGFVDLSTDLAKRERFFILRGEFGRIEIDEQARTWTVELPTSRRVTFPFRDVSTPAGLFRKVVTETLADTPSPCNGRQGMAALEMIVAMHVSEKRGNVPVVLPLAPVDQEMTINFP